MVRISDAYLAMLRKMHAQNTGFGVSGAKGAEYIREFGPNILDYGCGKGKLRETLGFDIQEYDPGIQGKDAEPRPADTVYCGDVMEHVEADCVADVLAHIASLVKPGGRAVFLISRNKAGKMLPDGRNAHITIKTWEEWTAELSRHFANVAQKPGTAPGEAVFTCSQ